jgi:short-subunit dehydrogenase
LGAEFAGQLAAGGFNLVLIDRLEEELFQLAERIERTGRVAVRPVLLDLCSDDLIGHLRPHTDDIDVGLLVYNAARSIIGPFLEHSVADHLDAINVNCRGPLLLSHHFGNRMARRSRGGIVLMSSFSAFQGSPMVAHYAATKAYNLVLAEGLWDELRAKGVDVLGVCPGPTRTPAYLSSLPVRSGLIPVPEMKPPAVVSEALSVLGRQAGLIPGRTNRLLGFALQRLLPRQWAVSLMGRTTRKMFARKNPVSIDTFGGS